MSLICIIQARMGSSRLPGKVLMPLASREALWHVYTRVSTIHSIDKVIIATSSEKQDDEIVEYCRNKGWEYFRGSETNVLTRYYDTATHFDATEIIRVTSDCPLINPQIISLLVHEFHNQSVDFISTNYPRRQYPVGLDCELMTIDALTLAHRNAHSSSDREHVTPYIYNNPLEFSLGALPKTEDLSHLRVTLDTIDDYRLLVNLFNRYQHNTENIGISEIREYFLSEAPK